MVCTARARSDLYQIDATWNIKFKIRIIQNTVCGLSIGAAAFTLSHSSNFVPAGWKGTGAVAYYLPIVILTIIFNAINIMWLGKNRCPLPTKPNAVVHTILALAFLILGAVCTTLVAGARGQLFNDPYDLRTYGSHEVMAANGTVIRVSSQNVASCPAFSDCAAQQHWLDRAYLRSGIAIGGCVLVDLAFLLHTGLSIWFILNVIHGVSPRPAIPRSEENEKHQEEKSSWAPDGNVAPKFERPLGYDSWNQSDAALLSSKHNFGVHDTGSCSSLPTSIISLPNTPRLHDSPREFASPALSSSSHFGPPQGSPGQYDNKTSPLSRSHGPCSDSNAPNFSRPSSRGGPSIPLPTQYSCYPQVTRSISQSSHMASPGLSHGSESGQPPNARPSTAEPGNAENDLTALPQSPPRHD